MTYKLEFYEEALKEWKKLDATVREQFRAKLIERLENPRIAGAKLRKSENRYKIKLMQVGYRLVYEVTDKTVTVTVIAVGKRNRNEVYLAAAKRDLKKRWFELRKQSWRSKTLQTGKVGTVTLGGVPEIDGSLAPKVALLLGCAYLMFGRKKQNTEVLIAV